MEKAKTVSDATPQAIEAMGHASADKEIQTQLHAGIVGQLQSQIEELCQRLDDPHLRSEELSESLAEAIALRSKQDHRLQTTLQPVIEEALRISVARDPAMLASALFPIIGEATRRSIAHTLQGPVDSLNQILDRSFSLESWKWRVEAWRSGKSFGEVALVRSLNFRVEQVFLIHRETGLLLGQVSFQEGLVRDADLIAGMLTAIQDFVRDSFGPKRTDKLEMMQVGDFKLWLQHAPLALLAAVVSGHPPPELREIFGRELEAIHREFGLALRQFDGDADAVAGSEVHLRQCMLGAESANAPKSYKLLWTAAAFVLLAIGTIAGLRIRDNLRWERYVERLQVEPGIVVIGAQHGWSGYSVRGLRDPMAADPLQILTEFHLPEKNVAERWELYLSLDPHFDEVRRQDRAGARAGITP